MKIFSFFDSHVVFNTTDYYVHNTYIYNCNIICVYGSYKVAPQSQNLGAKCSKNIITDPKNNAKMEANNLLKQISFIKEIDKLKFIQRKTKLFNSNRNENDAEHSWHLAMMTIVLAEHSDQSIDVLKVLKMVLIHDIVEIDAGDTFIYDTLKNHINTEEELKAANRIFGLLPKEQAEEFIAIWKEFEEGMTDEAKFAKAMDRFQPLLQNISNMGGTWTEFNVPYQKVYEKKKAIKNGSTTIWEYSESLINESVEKGVLIT